MHKIYYKKHKCLGMETHSVWMDEDCLVYGINTEKEAEIICGVVRLALEKCGVKILNSFDSQK